MRSPNWWKILATILMVTLAIEAFLFLQAYRQNRRYQELLSDIPSENTGAGGEPEPTSNPEGAEPQGGFHPEYPLFLEDVVEITAVSTGELSKIEAKNSYTGETLGSITVLKTTAKSSAGKLVSFPVVVQIFLAASPETDLIGWFSRSAAQSRNYDLSGQTEAALSMDQLEQIFSRESIWLLTPFVDLSVHEGRFARENQEYTYFARQYFGDSIALVEEYVESGLAKENYNSPLLMMGVRWVK